MKAFVKSIKALMTSFRNIKSDKIEDWTQRCSTKLESYSDIRTEKQETSNPYPKIERSHFIPIRIF